MKYTFHVAHFHINMVLLTRNMFKEVKVIKSRGALGTGFTYAPVWQSGGKPSTKFPHGGLVECPHHRIHLLYFYFKNPSFFIFPNFFIKLLSFSKFLKIWNLIDLALAFAFLGITISIFIFNIRSTRFSWGFLEGHRSKPCQLDHFGVVVYHFVRAQVCPA